MTDFNTWCASALYTLLEVSLQATLCVLLILLLRRALGKHLRPDWRYALWGVLILRMLLPFSYDAPLLSYAIPVTMSSPAPQPAGVADLQMSEAERPSEKPSISDLDLAPPSAPIASAPATTLPPPPLLAPSTDLVQPESNVEESKPAAKPLALPWSAAIFAIWLAGAAAILSIVTARHIRLTRAIERNAVPAPEPISRILSEVRDTLRVALWPAVLLTPAVATPTVVGVLRPRVFLPTELAETASREELRLILMHELMHLRRRDLWIACLWLAALSLHWFNPLMWYAGARLRRDREEACDLRVLAELPESQRASYGHTLIKSLTAMTREKRFTKLGGAAAIVEDQAELEGRLTMIKAYSPARTQHRVSGLLAAVALACVAFIQAWGAAQQQPPSSPEKLTPTSSSGPTPPTNPTVAPFSDIDDESKLVALRDEAAKSGDIVRACDAEMRRVKIRAAAGNAYKDKIDLSSVHEALPPPKSTEESTHRAAALDRYLQQHAVDNADSDYGWRVNHLLSLIARDLPDLKATRGFLDAAIRTYPRVAYPDPSKHSKFQHLVNQQAMLIWDQEGVDAAEKFVTDIWKKDRRFSYFFDAPWDARYRREKLAPDRLAKLTDSMGDKAPPIEVRILLTPGGMWYVEKPATWTEIERYLSEIPSRFEYYITLGYTSDDMPIKTWQNAQDRLAKLAGDLGFDHFSAIGLQELPPDAAVRLSASPAAGTPRKSPETTTQTNLAKNRLQQLGLVFKLFSSNNEGENYPPQSSHFGSFSPQTESIYPEYLPDLEVMDLFRDQADFRAIYFGYAIQDPIAAHAYLDAYEARRPAATRARDFQTKEGSGSTRFTDQIFALREGIERLFITDINVPGAAAIAASQTPVLWELPKKKSSGGLVLYIDGHIEWVEYPGKFPMDESVIERVRKIMATPAQPVPTASLDLVDPVDMSNPLDIAMNAEIQRYYFDTSQEVQDFLRSTARSFGPSGLWLPEDWRSGFVRDPEVPPLTKLFEEGTYGRHLCEGLANASTIKDKRLVPGLLKIAAYHLENQDYDCRPKWMAIAALARQEDEAAIPVLVPLVDHGNLNIRMWAQAALARITKQSFGADKQAWANWWNAAGRKPALGPDAIKPWKPPVQPSPSPQE